MNSNDTTKNAQSVVAAGNASSTIAPGPADKPHESKIISEEEKMNSDTEIKNAPAELAAAGDASSTLAPGSEGNMQSILQNLSMQVANMQGSMDMQMATMKGSMATMNAKLDRVINALPVAHDHPEVTLAASQSNIKKACRDGGTATWTYGLHQEVLVLVSVLHSLSQVEKRDGYLVFKLTAEIVKDLEKKKLTLKKIGVREEFYASKFKNFSQKHTVVLLQLNRTKLPEGIHPMVVSHQEPQDPKDFHNVVGSSLSGKVHGTSLVASSPSECFVFVPEFCEGGNSGTAMFAVKMGMEVRFVGVFKGTAAQKTNLRDRGVIVPVPEQIQWLDIVAVGKPQMITIAGDGDGDRDRDGQSTILSAGPDVENKRMLLVKFPKDFPDNFAKKNLIRGRDASDSEASQAVLPCVQGFECDGDWDDYWEGD